MCTTRHPKINIQSWTINADFDIARMSILSDMLGVKRIVMRKLAAAWIYSYNMSEQGKKAINKLTSDILNIDAMIVDTIMNT